MEIKNFKKTGLPDKPGVYFFIKTSPRPSPERRGGSFNFQGKVEDEVLYIGKATSLKDRVKSYMSKTVFDMRGPLIEKMVQETKKIEFQVTDSVLEALILEANLIKKYQPYYNTKEKDDKSFNFVCITKTHKSHGLPAQAGVNELPKVVILRGKNVQPSVLNKIYGPYTSGTQLREAVKIIRRIFPFLDDKSKNYMEFYKQINLVPDLGDRKMYLQNIRNIKLFFAGKRPQILRNLKKQMQEYAKVREFEKAGEIKRQMFALQHINDVALLKTEQNFSFAQSLGPSLRSATPSQNQNFIPFRIESYDIAHMGGKNMVGVMTVVENGEVNKSEYKKFRIRTQGDANDTGALVEVLERRLAHTEWIYPSLIVVDGGIAQINAVKKVFRKLNIEIPVVSVLKDERHKPKDIMGDNPRHGGASKFAVKYKREILLANSEAHRFAIAYHKKLRNKNFLP